MTKDEGLRIAIDAMQYANTGNRRPEILGPAIKACEEAMAQETSSHSDHYWAHEIDMAHIKGYQQGRASAQKEALAQPEPELTEKLQRLLREDFYLTNGQAWDLAEKIAPFCAHPKEWQDLTDEEIRECFAHLENVTVSEAITLISVVRTTQASLKEKNA